MAHHSNHPHHHQHSKRKQVHKDWRIWTVVILMLAAMAVYVFTMDEELELGPDGQPMPAMEAPAAE